MLIGLRQTCEFESEGQGHRACAGLIRYVIERAYRAFSLNHAFFIVGCPECFAIRNAMDVAFTSETVTSLTHWSANERCQGISTL